MIIRQKDFEIALLKDKLNIIENNLYLYKYYFDSINFNYKIISNLVIMEIIFNAR